MTSFLRTWLGSRPKYRRRRSLVLINGLAEQAETWYCNVPAWRRHFDVYQPALLAYEGEALHRRIVERRPIDVQFLVGQLHSYLQSFVQSPPYSLVANSMGGKVAVEFAVRYPELVDKLALLCPSGLAEVERLPMVEGVRRNDMRSVVESVFHNPLCGDRGVIEYYEKQVANKRWRSGLLRTIRGTMDHNVRDRLAEVTQPTLLVIGDQDRIVDPAQSAEAASRLRNGRVVILRNCGHAPQIERARQVNRLVTEFLR